MIEINGKKLCPGCFSISESGTKCNICAYADKNDTTFALPAETVLNGKYAIGRVALYDDVSYTYIAYNLAAEQRVLIKEFFPYHSLIKRGSDSVSVNVESSGVSVFEKSKNKFLAAIQSAAQLNDSGSILTISELFAENNTVYQVSEFPMDAMLLCDYPNTFGKRPDQKAAMKIFADTITALDIIHSKGFVHGNIRPENIVLRGNKVFLTGMENGFMMSPDDSTAVTVPSKRIYSAPELFSAAERSSCLADIYSLGATLVHIISGKNLPFAMNRFDTSDEYSIFNATEISMPLREIIIKSVSLVRNKRYQNLYELCQALNKAKLSKVSVKKPADMVQSAKEKKGSGKKKLIIIISAIVAGVLILASSVAAGIYLFRGKTPETKPEEPVETTVNEENEEESSKKETPEKAEEAAPKSEEIPEAKPEEPEKSPEEKPEINVDIPKNIPKPTTVKPPQIKDSVPKEGSVALWQDNNMRNTKELENSKYVLNNTAYLRSEIVAVEFHDTLEKAGSNAWDVSMARDGRVKAWVEQTGKRQFRLHIGAEGGINGVESTHSLFYNYGEVTSIKFNNCFHTDYATDMSLMFKNCRSLKSLDLQNINTPKVSDMDSMFENCTALSSLKFTKGFVTDNVICMQKMFNNCYTLTELDVSNFNTEKVEDMGGMFAFCSSLKSLDLDGFKTARVKTMAQMFYKCSRLKNLKISAFSVKNETDIARIFDGCSKLKDVSMSNSRLQYAFDSKK